MERPEIERPVNSFFMETPNIMPETRRLWLKRYLRSGFVFIQLLNKPHISPYGIIENAVRNASASSGVFEFFEFSGNLVFSKNIAFSRFSEILKFILIFFEPSRFFSVLHTQEEKWELI